MDNILEKANAWINERTIDQEDRDEIKNLINTSNHHELTEAFL